MSDRPEWTMHHFSQANPKGEGQGDVPGLLRRVADTVESLGPVDVYDITFHTEVTGDGHGHSMTVYYDPRTEEGAVGAPDGTVAS